ncbi:divalent-cation tolerance protein CutA [mine drainage metagenome]|uniref:Divalent-cation tolerance protein CutA n=1 Tax=mine drainage metagenome TaxID=410659 RepID=A0A1J5RAJ6_9ZZZZ
MDACLVYVTAAHRDEARAIAQALVEQRLAACVNLLEGITSVYRWDGALHEDSEALLLIKTRSENTSRLIATIKEMHSYTNRPMN